MLMAKEGYVPFPSTKAVGDQTTFVPKVLLDRLKSLDAPTGAVWKGINRANRAFKTLALPLSPKWMLGNVVGNAMMAVGFGGVGPIKLAAEMRRLTKEQGGIKELWKEGGVGKFDPAELQSHGLTYGEHNLMYGDKGTEEGKGRIRTAMGNTIAKSYNLNEFVDNMTRSAVYRAKLGKGIPTEAALKSTLNAMGDFTRLTPFERNYVRQVIPFYPWIRHQTQAIMRLPIESPARAIWLLQVSQMFSDPDMSTDMLKLVGSKIPLGDKFLNLGSLSPFANPAELPFSPTQIGGSLSPALKFPIEAFTGVNPDKGFAPLSRPGSTQGQGLYGPAKVTSPISRILGGNVRQGLGELGYMAAGALPYTRTVRDVALGPGKTRTDTGYATKYASGKTRLGELYAGLNLPTVKAIRPPTKEKA